MVPEASQQPTDLMQVLKASSKNSNHGALAAIFTNGSLLTKTLTLFALYFMFKKNL